MPRIPVLRPQIATFSEVEKYLRRMDETRWYSNWGPLLIEFEKRLAQASGLFPENLAVVGNATMGLSMALRAVLGDDHVSPPRVAVPNWTFAATPGAVASNGWQPEFLDIDATTFAMSQKELMAAHQKTPLAAAIPVAVFGSPLDYDSWERLSSSTALPLVYDLAASMDQLLSGELRGKVPRNPMVFSLHATKTFGVGEGAVIASSDEELIRGIKSYSNFGFWGSRESLVAGTNAKLSEVHAAYGLAAFDGWAQKRQMWLRVRNDYLRELAGVKGVRLFPGRKESWVSSYMHVVTDTAEQAGALETRLVEAGVETRRWWGFGMNKHRAYRTDSSFPVCDDVSARSLGLPCYTDLSSSQIEFVCRQIRDFSATFVKRSHASVR